jgi:hypothetical protein
MHSSFSLAGQIIIEWLPLLERKSPYLLHVVMIRFSPGKTIAYKFLSLLCEVDDDGETIVRYTDCLVSLHWLFVRKCEKEGLNSQCNLSTQGHRAFLGAFSVAIID